MCEESRIIKRNLFQLLDQGRRVQMNRARPRPLVALGRRGTVGEKFLAPRVKIVCQIDGWLHFIRSLPSPALDLLPGRCRRLWLVFTANLKDTVTRKTSLQPNSLPLAYVANQPFVSSACESHTGFGLRFIIAFRAFPNEHLI